MRQQIAQNRFNASHVIACAPERLRCEHNVRLRPVVRQARGLVVVFGVVHVVRLRLFKRLQRAAAAAWPRAAVIAAGGCSLRHAHARRRCGAVQSPSPAAAPPPSAAARAVRPPAPPAAWRCSAAAISLFSAPPGRLLGQRFVDGPLVHGRCFSAVRAVRAHEPVRRRGGGARVKCRRRYTACTLQSGSENSITLAMPCPRKWWTTQLSTRRR